MTVSLPSFHSKGTFYSLLQDCWKPVGTNSTCMRESPHPRGVLLFLYLPSRNHARISLMNQNYYFLILIGSCAYPFGRNARIGNKMRHLEQQQVLTLTCSKKSFQKRLIAHNWTSLVSRNVRRYIHYILMCTERCELLVLGTKRNSSALMFGLLHQSIVNNNCSSYLHGRYSVVNVRSSARHCSVVHARRCLVNYSKIVKRWLKPESNEGVPRTTLLVI